MSGAACHEDREIIIDPEFRALIPPPTLEELNELERQIVAHGIREPLVVWLGHNILLDGHNRYAIAKRLGVRFNAVGYEFETREQAADWIDRNQLGRRNLSDDQLSLLRGRIYNRRKLPLGGHKASQKARCNSCTQLSGPSATAAMVAKEVGGTPRSIINDGNFATAVETLKPLVPDIEQRVISGSGPTRKAVKEAAAVAKADPDMARKIVAPPPPKPNTNGLKRLPQKPMEERLERGVARIVSIVETVSAEDFAALSGSTSAMKAADDVRGAVRLLKSLIKTLEG